MEEDRKHAPKKPLRDRMPLVSAFIDDLREAFGAELINAQIKAGMGGQPVFYASENGSELGTALPAVGSGVIVDAASGIKHLAVGR